MALRSVDFPQPEAPSATTKARSGMSSDTRSSACTVRPSRAEKKTLALSTRSTSYGIPGRERWSAANAMRRRAGSRRETYVPGFLSPAIASVVTNAA